MEDIVKTIFDQMSNIKKPQRTFMTAFFAVLMIFQGKATYSNMSRYSSLSQKRFTRWSSRQFDFVEFNTIFLLNTLPEKGERIAAIDASFMAKSGKQTEGLGKYYNGCAGKAERGLEISTVCVTDLKANTAYTLDTRQTIDAKESTRVDFYAQQVVDLQPYFHRLKITHLVGDAYYSKKKFVEPVLAVGLDLVGKLRVDADLRWLYQGDYSGVGRPKKFDGKVCFDTEVSRFENVGVLNDKVNVYSQIVYSCLLKRSIRVVMLRWNKKQGIGRALLYSTDINLEPMKLIRYYQARFQIEFTFRDAKQYTGLTHCQSLRKKAIHLHINAALCSLNLLKREDKKEKQTEEESVISIASWKRRKFNENLMDRLFTDLDLDPSNEKVSMIYEKYRHYGSIAS
jgi:hypothetical protein